MRSQTSRLTRPLALGAATLVALAGLMTVEPASAAPPPSPVSAFLAKQLPSLTGTTTVLVHGDTLADAKRAIKATAMKQSISFDKIGVVGAVGTKAQIEAVRRQPGVSYVEAGKQPIELLDATSNTATRGVEAGQTQTGADGTALTGTGVSVAVIDSGVDPTHPAFAEADGSSAVVANLKTLCDPFELACSVQKLPAMVDTDTLSGGGHGTHVNGIVAGNPVTLSDEPPSRVPPPEPSWSRSRPARCCSSSAPTRPSTGSSRTTPRRAGRASRPAPARRSRSPTTPTAPPAAGRSTPTRATVKLQRALVDEGVVTVWANGNDGGDGSASLSNPPGMDPTGGILSAASYYDQDTGTRDGVVSDFSSRGQAGDQSTYPDISAPGENITSACRLYLPICSTGLDPQNGPGPLDIGTFNTISGTSMAAPTSRASSPSCSRPTRPRRRRRSRRR